MTRYKQQNGIWIPKEKPQPEKNTPVYLNEWDCPNCGVHYDTSKQENEEYTVGHIGPGPWIPHIICPSCKECMGCSSI